MSIKTKSVPLLVTTQHKGVFFGYGTPTTASEIILEKARMCIYWSNDMKGVLGLATIGPSKTCRVGLAVPSLMLRAVTSISEVTDEAKKAWEKGPWQQ